MELSPFLRKCVTLLIDKISSLVSPNSLLCSLERATDPRFRENGRKLKTFRLNDVKNCLILRICFEMSIT
jgi:hypothetical protein